MISEVRKKDILSEYICQQCGSAGYRRPLEDKSILCGKCYIEFIANRKKQRDNMRDMNKVFTQEDAKNVENIIELDRCLGGYSIKIPEGYEEIDDFAICCDFLPCFMDVIIPASVTKIGYGAFDSLGIAAYRVHKDNPAFFSTGDNYYGANFVSGGVLFSKDGKKLIKYPSIRGTFRGLPYVVPDCVESIGEEAFLGWQESGRGVILPESLLSIGPAAFSGCSHMRAIAIPASVLEIWDTAFRKCCFESITVTEGNTNYICEDGVLYNYDKTVLLKYPALNKQEHFEIPDTVLVIGVAAFSNCEHLKTIEIPKSVEIISNGTFAGCEFESIGLPESLRLIGYHVFEGCDKIKNITIPLGVTKMDEEAFFGCDANIIYREYPGGIAASKDDIKRWFLEGVRKGAQYMVIICDKMDLGDDPDFPSYANDIHEAHEIVKKYDGKEVFKVMEVYNLTEDMEVQLNETRAWKLP